MAHFSSTLMATVTSHESHFVIGFACRIANFLEGTSCGHCQSELTFFICHQDCFLRLQSLVWSQTELGVLILADLVNFLCGKEQLGLLEMGVQK